MQSRRSRRVEADLLESLRNGMKNLGGKKHPSPLLAPLPRPASQDTQTVIRDLSRIVRNNPEAVDIYLALGNLFRAEGDVERAVLIREGLIARHGLEPGFKARAYFELGQDYFRAGVVDRALAAFEEAARLGHPASAVAAQLAEVYASSGQYEKAAAQFAALKDSPAQAHYMVCRARELACQGDRDQALRLCRKALKVYPGSAEAWSQCLALYAGYGSWGKVGSFLEKGLASVAPNMQFLLLETLLQAEPSPAADGDPAAARKDQAEFFGRLCKAALPVLDARQPGSLLQFYAVQLLLRAGRTEEAETRLAKALVEDPEFWGARVLALQLAAEDQDLPGGVRLQIEYFSRQLPGFKRFKCTTCGFRENQVFHRCRRCGSWHSLAYRLTLHD